MKKLQHKKRSTNRSKLKNKYLNKTDANFFLLNSPTNAGCVVVDIVLYGRSIVSVLLFYIFFFL